MAITDNDWRIVHQNIIDLMVELKVYDSSDTLLDTLYGVVNGGKTNADASSAVRRTATFVIIPTKQITNLTEKSLVWLNKNVKVRLGILDLRTNERVWYNCGSYIYNDASTQYDESTNEMTINLSDWMLKLDGTVNGQVGGAITTIIPAYVENEITGEPISYNAIKDSLETVLSQLGGLSASDYEVCDIGEYKAMPQYNENYLVYRQKYPLWNIIPYDLEFSTGETVYSIIEQLATLYPNYDAAYNEDGKFIVQMIPSAYSDDIVIPYHQIFDLVISESTQTDLTTIRNICEVWGETIDAEYFVDSVPMDENDIYTVTINGYESYNTGDRFAFVFSQASVGGQLLKINNLESLVIYKESNDEVVGIGDIDTTHIHVFKITTAYDDNGDFVKKLMWLGVDQAHGVNVLTDGTVVENGFTDSSGTYDLYSLAYYQHIFNCENVSLTTIVTSPFTVQKLGNRIDVKSGGEFANITSDELALERAEYENWKNCRLTDTVTITTKIMPFVQPYQKVSYIKNGYKEKEQFIVQDCSHDLDNGTTTVTMYKFYPLYQDTIDNGGLRNMTYGEMRAYTYTDLYGDDDT